jgi:hypothetical protein
MATRSFRALAAVAVAAEHLGDGGEGATAFRDERVYVNEAQYFEGATERSWDFFIDGYQPAQKWLKDRRCRTLTPANILHYERILRALDLTAEIMVEIDGISGSLIPPQ